MNLEGKIVVVFGEKLEGNGNLGENYKRRIEKAREVYIKDDCDDVIISGGKTRAQYVSEAKAAANYFRIRYGIEAMIEERALTTSENVSNVAEIVGENPERIYIISDKERLRRIDFLCRNLCPKIYDKIYLVPSDNSFNLAGSVKETLHLFYNHFDLHEKSPVFKFLKKIFRNGK